MQSTLYLLVLFIFGALTADFFDQYCTSATCATALSGNQDVSTLPFGLCLPAFNPAPPIGCGDNTTTPNVFLQWVNYTADGVLGGPRYAQKIFGGPNSTVACTNGTSIGVVNFTCNACTALPNGLNPPVSGITLRCDSVVPSPSPTPAPGTPTPAPGTPTPAPATPTPAPTTPAAGMMKVCSFMFLVLVVIVQGFI